MGQKYNGWTNYETWAVALWLNNDHMATLAAGACTATEADSTFTLEERAALELAERLQEEIEDANPLADQATLYADLLNTALSEVDYYEIACYVLMKKALK